MGAIPKLQRRLRSAVCDFGRFFPQALSGPKPSRLSKQPNKQVPTAWADEGEAHFRQDLGGITCDASLKKRTTKTHKKNFRFEQAALSGYAAISFHCSRVVAPGCSCKACRPRPTSLV